MWCQRLISNIAISSHRTGIPSQDVDAAMGDLRASASVDEALRTHQPGASQGSRAQPRATARRSPYLPAGLCDPTCTFDIEHTLKNGRDAPRLLDTGASVSHVRRPRAGSVARSEQGTAAGAGAVPSYSGTSRGRQDSGITCRVFSLQIGAHGRQSDR